MNNKEVIKVLQDLVNDTESGCGCSSGKAKQALIQAIGTLKMVSDFVNTLCNYINNGLQMFTIDQDKG